MKWWVSEHWWIRVHVNFERTIKQISQQWWILQCKTHLMSRCYCFSMKWEIICLSCSCTFIGIFFLGVRKPLTLSLFRSLRSAPLLLHPNLYASSPLNKQVPWLNYGFTESACPSSLDPIILLSGCSLTHIIILLRKAYGITVPSIIACSTYSEWHTAIRTRCLTHAVEIPFAGDIHIRLFIYQLLWTH